MVMPAGIGREELRTLTGQGAQLAEVLPAEEYAWAHLPGAVSLPLGTGCPGRAAGLLPGQPRASTTIVTVLTHLIDKGLVVRAGDGRRYTYRPAGDPDQLTARAIERLLAAAGDRRAVLAHLVNGAQDPALRAELAALIQQTQADGDTEGRP